MTGSPGMIRTICRIQPAESILLCMSLISDGVGGGKKARHLYRPFERGRSLGDIHVTLDASGLVVKEAVFSDDAFSLRCSPWPRRLHVSRMTQGTIARVPSFLGKGCRVRRSRRTTPKTGPLGMLN